MKKILVIVKKSIFYILRREFIMKKELEKNYNPADIETRLYEKWQEKKSQTEEAHRHISERIKVTPSPRDDCWSCRSAKLSCI